MSFTFQGKLPLAMLLVLTLLVASGCQQRVVGTLQGRWVGVPDTAAARAERESQKYGDMPHLLRHRRHRLSQSE